MNTEACVHEWTLLGKPGGAFEQRFCSLCGRVEAAPPRPSDETGPDRHTQGDSAKDVAEITQCLAPTIATPVQPSSEPLIPLAMPVGRDDVIPNYVIEGVLGRGGMGIVYRAVQRSLKRTVALKMILAGADAGTEERARFNSEAEAVARLQHPNVVQIHEIGEHQGRPFFSLEFVEGGSLAARIAGKPRPTDEAARTLAELARAMHYCHQRGIVHRDLKPANVLLTSDGIPKLTDFGLAKQMEGDSGQTRTGAIMGTPCYMAPEQASGRTHEIGPPADVYALGAILYELLTGRPPFTGATPLETIEKVRHHEPTPPAQLRAGVPRDLETICLKCLAKEPERRYHSALALVQDLERFLAGEPILGRRERLVHKLWRKARRHPVAALSLAALAVGLTAALAIGISAQRMRASTDFNLLVNDRVRALDEGLAQETWTREHLDSLTRQADELRSLSPDKGEAAHKRIVVRFQRVFQDSYLEKPALDKADVAQAETLLAWLAERDANLAATLRQGVKERLSTVSLVVDLSKSLDKLGEVFVYPGQVERNGTVLQRPQQGSPPPELVQTRASCLGDVEIEARFTDWQSATHVGFVLGAKGIFYGADDAGYAFRLVPTEAAYARRAVRTKSLLLGEALKLPDGELALQISRRGTRLRELPVRLGEGKELLLRAARKGGRLTFEAQAGAGERTALEVEDLFPSGAFARTPVTPPAVIVKTNLPNLVAVDPNAPLVCTLIWPRAVGINALRVWRPTLSVAPSALERGDEAFAVRKFADALSEYRAVERSAREAEVRQGARCKEAICLLELGKPDEAAARFEQVVGEPGMRWPLVAACHLWPLRVTQHRFADSDATLRWLTSHYTSEQAALLIPDDIRARIRQARDAHLLSAFIGTATFYHLIKYDPERAKNLERALDIERFLDGKDSTSIRWRHIRVILITGYHATGDTKRALELATEVLPKPHSISLDAIHIYEEYGWLMRLEAAATGKQALLDKALADLNAYLFPPGGQHYMNAGQLHLERARLHAALQKWDEAEKDIEILFGRFRGDLLRPDAWVIRGFLRERRGDKEGALKVWREGWETCKRTQAIYSLFGSMLGSLSGAVDEADARKMVDDAMKLVGPFSPVAATIRNDLLSVPFVTAVVRERWRGPRGHEWARKVAFQEVPYRDFHGMVVPLTLHAAFRQGSFAGNLSAEQDELVWKCCLDLYEAFGKTGTFTEAQAFQGALAWTGTTGVFGWGGLKPGLTPALRGPIAYILGRHYLALQKQADAINFFKTAVAEGAPDAPLRKLAQAELDQLKVP